MHLCEFLDKKHLGKQFTLQDLHVNYDKEKEIIIKIFEEGKIIRGNILCDVSYWRSSKL